MVFCPINFDWLILCGHLARFLAVQQGARRSDYNCFTPQQ
ncbi:hypothetical protein RintRC_0685 [Richelia intracellularis]|nr:hypothetical protein RintRC_0685 [Richelia intracellularis]